MFKLRKHTSSETKFALYTTKDHNKIYYLKPESGAIVAEESSSPDSYYYFSMSKYIEVRHSPYIIRVIIVPSPW